MKVNIVGAGLIHTETAELQEAMRDNNLSEAELECSDIIIRVMNFCSRLHLDLEGAILKKHQKNMNREKLHGRTI